MLFKLFVIVTNFLYTGPFFVILLLLVLFLPDLSDRITILFILNRFYFFKFILLSG